MGGTCANACPVEVLCEQVCVKNTAESKPMTIGKNFQPEFSDSDDFPAVEQGRIRVNAERRTSLNGVWAGGDCVPGLDLTVTAVQDGKLAALSIHQFLGGTQS